jgi:hypothetical protein
MADEDRISTILASDEAFECQECHWQGRNFDRNSMTQASLYRRVGMSAIRRSALRRTAA